MDCWGGRQAGNCRHAVGRGWFDCGMGAPSDLKSAAELPCVHSSIRFDRLNPTYTHQEEEQPQEEQPDPLKEALEAAEETAATDPKAGIAAYHAVLATPGREGDEAAQRIKEEAIYRCFFFWRFAFCVLWWRWRRWLASVVSRIDSGSHAQPNPVHMTPLPKTGSRGCTPTRTSSPR